MPNLGYKVNIVRVVNSTAPGTSNVTGTHVDMQGYDGVLFLLCVGTLTATQVTGMKVQGGTLSNDSDQADLAGSSNSSFKFPDADSNDMYAVDVYRPGFRYIRPIVTRGTANAAIDAVIAIQYQRDKESGQNSLDATLAGLFVLPDAVAGTA